MARGKFGLSDEEFWSTSPRTIYDLIRNWRNIEIGMARMNALVAAGGEVDMYEEDVADDSPQTVDARFL